MVITCASHAQGPRFEPGRKHLFWECQSWKQHEYYLLLTLLDQGALWNRSMPKWRHWSDSNQRSPVYETGALPLGHSANNSHWITITNVYNFSCSFSNFNSDSSQLRRRGDTRKMKSSLVKGKELHSSTHHVRVAAGKKIWPPRRGIEPRSPAWQAGILTTILPRNGCDVHNWRCQPRYTSSSSDNLSYNSFASHRTHYLNHKHDQRHANPNWPGADMIEPSARSTAILRQIHVMQQEVRKNVFVLNNSLPSLQHPM